ncbi:MAG: methylamine dehydrogenase heavy chain family protein [Herbaspirillum sp.]|jgi:YVTN family beta-propeller protein|nr:methylamine dehydrogenase heavy chain family protein [Herbaspirillum sp.]
MRIINKTTLCMALTAGAIVAPDFAQAVQADSIGASYKVAAQYPIGGSDGWDYMAFDGKRSRLFISRGRHVQVMDTKSGKLIGEIPDTDGVHGIAFAQDLKLGFTSNGKANTVSVFNLDTLAVVDTIKVSGVKPDFIYYEPAHKRIYTSNGGSANITAIDATTRKVVATIDLGGSPEAMVSDKGGRYLYVNLEDKNELLKIDAQAGKVVARWPIAACDAPTGLAFDTQHQRLFSVCHSANMMVVDAKSGKVVSTVASAKFADAAAFDPKQHLVYSSNGEGALMVVREDSPNAYTVQSKLTTMPGAKTMALDPKTHRVYLVSSQFSPAPAATAENPHPHPAIVPDTVVVLVAEPSTVK